MLEITIPKKEMFNETLGKFIYTKEQKIKMEHSLVSISKWEMKYHKPYLSKDNKTLEESLYYLQCMTITQNVDPLIYYSIDYQTTQLIRDYMENPMTATVIHNRKPMKQRRGFVTSELVYFWMFSYGIPIECEKWHFNRLMKLIEVFSVENSNQKMSPKDLASYNSKINAARRAKHPH